MTDPLPGTEPVPLTPPSQPITGDSHHHLIAPLIAHAAALGYSVEIRDLPQDGPGGWCDPKRKHIVVAAGPGNCHVRTLVHEIAHAHGLGYAEYGRKRCEVLVDCVTYRVLGSAGLDVASESIPYLAGWGEDGALDAIREYAQTIDTVARRIEDALASGGDPNIASGAPADRPRSQARRLHPRGDPRTHIGTHEDQRQQVPPQGAGARSPFAIVSCPTRLRTTGGPTPARVPLVD